jgi:SAM-dependent methyltransferase
MADVGVTRPTTRLTLRKTGVRAFDGASPGALDPCSLVRRFGARVAQAAAGMPVLDIGCGSGRNAFLLSDLGCTVVCLDRDMTSLQRHQRGEFHQPPGTPLILRQIDFLKDPWPFAASSIGGIINVHFLCSALFPFFVSSLALGAYLLLETPPGCGGNYRELPAPGELEAAFRGSFDFEYYKERPVGPQNRRAVSVQMLARRRELGC